jgi:hypothetical protein
MNVREPRMPKARHLSITAHPTMLIDPFELLTMNQVSLDTTRNPNCSPYLLGISLTTL